MNAIIWLLLSVVGYAITLVVLLFIVFVFFCAVMKLRTVRDSGYLNDAPAIIRVYAYLTLDMGLLADLLLNVLLSILFLELPQEWLTTDRAKRLKVSGNPWQKACANWLCVQLNNLDEKHCG